MKNKRLDAKILIVDDEEHIINIINLTLQDSVKEIIKAYNGVEALKLFNENRDVCCILSDIRMPKMDGIEFIKEVRKIDKEIPFIFFTGFGYDKYLVQAVKYGAFDFINKPELDNVVEITLKAINEFLAKKDNTDSSKNDQLKSDFDDIL